MTKLVHVSGAVELIRSVSPTVALMVLTKSPVCALAGLDAPNTAVESTHEHHEYALTSGASTVPGGATAVATTVNVATGDGVLFFPDDVLQVDGLREVMSVDSVATDALTVTRAIRGSTGEVILAGAVITIIQRPFLEGGDFGDAVPENRLPIINQIETFAEHAAVSEQWALSKSAVDIKDELEWQITIKQWLLFQRMCASLISGRLLVPSGSNAAAMNGIIPSITDGADPVILSKGGAGLVEEDFNTIFRRIRARGGKANVIAPSSAQADRIATIFTGRQRFSGKDSVMGVNVTEYNGPHGVLKVLDADEFVPPDCILCLDPAKLNVAKLGGGRLWNYKNLSESGLAKKRAVWTDLTLEIKNAGDGGHGLIQQLEFDL